MQRHRRGSAATQSLLSLTVLLGFAAFAVDGGWMWSSRSQLQSVADASALAGAAVLGESDPKAEAIGIAGQNSVAGQVVLLTEDQVRIGDFDPETGTFTDDPDGDVVWVETRLPEVSTFLGSLLGQPSFAVRAVGVAGRYTTPGSWMGPCLLFGDESLTIPGNAWIDGYDSRYGYSASSGASASVCTNVLDAEITGNAEIHGNFHPGPGGTVDVDGSAVLTGDATPLDEEIEMEEVEAPHVWDNQGMPANVRDAYTVSGTLYYDEDFRINARGEVNVSGATEIYVDGDVTINGQGFVNTRQDPHDLTIYVIGDHKVTVNGSSDFYGRIVAPEGEVDLKGTADFYGAIEARDTTVTGTGRIHLDTSLADDTPEAVGGSTSAVRLYAVY